MIPQEDKPVVKKVKNTKQYDFSYFAKKQKINEKDKIKIRKERLMAKIKSNL